MAQWFEAIHAKSARRMRRRRNNEEARVRHDVDVERYHLCLTIDRVSRANTKRIASPYSIKSQCSLTTSWQKLRRGSLDVRRKPARS